MGCKGQCFDVVWQFGIEIVEYCPECLKKLEFYGLTMYSDQNHVNKS